LPRQQRPDLELVDVLAQRRELGGGLRAGRLVVLLLGQLEHDLGVDEPPAQLVQPGQLALQVGQPPGDRLRPLLVGPQPGIACLLSVSVAVARSTAGSVRSPHSASRCSGEPGPVTISTSLASAACAAYRSSRSAPRAIVFHLSSRGSATIWSRSLVICSR